ncbi:MAG: hypothetical protein LBO64_05495 [Desulfovibrio sp.]|nr:hypothetical protein [Desulfovibrio sp.]
MSGSPATSAACGFAAMPMTGWSIAKAWLIGHLKNYFRLARNYLKGAIGDALNLLLAAAAFNCRKWMNAVAERLLFVLFVLCAMMWRRNELQHGTA